METETTTTKASPIRLAIVHQLPPRNIGGHPLRECTACGRVFYDVPGQTLHGEGRCA